MKDDDDKERTGADQRYELAYAAHYSEKSLDQALELYLGVMADLPSTVEAGYAREQIRNIARDVVPEQELLDSMVKLARVHLGSTER